MKRDRGFWGAWQCQAVPGLIERRRATRYCGVCFFPLPLGALSIKTYNGGAFPSELLHDHWQFTTLWKDFQNIVGSRYRGIGLLAVSADRGCTTCAALRDILTEQHPSLFAARSGGATKDTDDNHYRMWRWNWNLFTGSMSLSVDTRSPIPYKFFTLATNYADLLPKGSQNTFKPGGLLSYDTASDAAFARVTTWLAECTAMHTLCSDGGEPSALPRRVLRITDDDEPGIILKLVDGAGLKEPYACLSYRWVTKTQPLMLGTDNEKQFRDGITKEQLPRLFRDTCNAVRRLGLRYLWIDSLCILQDDKHDWRTEAAAMASVFNGAYITVAALVSNGCDDSLFRKHDPGRMRNPVVTTADGSPLYMMQQLPHPRHNGHENCAIFPLLKRGWVFQERMLSRRVVYFSKEEVIWNCFAAMRCECRNSEDPAAHTGKPWQFKNTKWTDAVAKFTSLSLTEASDKLPALAGVAKMLNSQADDPLQPPLRWDPSTGRTTSSIPRPPSEYPRGPYLAGIWASDIHRGLQWRCGSGGSSLLPRPKPLVAPTWSWASACGRISYSDDIDMRYPVTVQMWEMDFVGPDEFGHVSHGRLTVAAHVFLATVHYGSDYMACSRAPLHPNTRWRVVADGAFGSGNFVAPPLSHASRDTDINRYEVALVVDGYSFDWRPDYTLQMSGDGYVASGTLVRCLILSKEFVLIARCVDAARGHYERLGCISASFLGLNYAVIVDEWVKSTVIEDTVLV